MGLVSWTGDRGGIASYCRFWRSADRCGFEGRFGAFRRIEGPTVKSHEAIIEIPVGGEDQPVTDRGQRRQSARHLNTGFGARALRVFLDDADSLCLWVANLRKGSDTFVTYSKNLKQCILKLFWTPSDWVSTSTEPWG